MDPVIQPSSDIKKFFLMVPTIEWAKAVALSMIDEGQAFHVEPLHTEPYPDGCWCFTVDSEHEEALRRHAS